MTLGEQWLRRPQNVWLRKAIFQIHLWTGIGLGLYVLLISVSGSAIVFRNEIYKSAGRGPRIVAVSGPRLTPGELKSAVSRQYPGYTAAYTWEGKIPGLATEIWLERDGKSKRQRLFDPYTGKDLGPSIPYAIRVLAWLSDLHTNLLFARTGRAINGVASMLLTLLCLTGAVIWWPGIKNWRRSLTIHPKSNWKRLNWDLHSAIGFWSFALIFMWAITGVYLVFPLPFQRAVNFFSPLQQYRLDVRAQPAPQAIPQISNEVGLVRVADESPGPNRIRRRFAPIKRSPGDILLRWLYYLHFGNFAGWRVKVLWVVLGFLPPVLLITGILMWWNRVLSGEARRSRRKVDVATAA